MPKRISWKKGMRLTDEVLLAADNCTAEALSQAFMLGCGGRFGLFPSAIRPFEMSLSINNGYVDLNETPRINDSGYYEISAHQLSQDDSIEKPFQQGAVPDDEHFAISSTNGTFLLPTSLSEGDVVEILYEFNAYKGTEIVNSVTTIPETWKVRFLLLVSPVCNTEKIMSVWVTANNATPDISTELNFELDETIPIRLELGCTVCDGKKKLYEIVLADNSSNGSDGVLLRTHDGEAVNTYDNEAMRTIR